MVDTARVRIEQARWFEMLAASDFFLVCIGASMPLSHNIIESMALGITPVTSYTEFFDPPLEDGVTCIAFSDCDSLAGAVEKELSMPEGEIARMRGAVTAYYDAHLNPASFVARASSTKRRFYRRACFLHAGVTTES